MANKIIGVGLGKTGTTTLGVALTTLGVNHCHFRKDLVSKYAEGRFDDIYAVADEFDSFADFPWPLMYRELDARYPDSKFILTVRRSPELWYDSLCRHAERIGPTEERVIAYGYSHPADNEKHHIDLYNRHSDDVTGYFSGRKDDLLVVCWENGDGWRELCSFLQMDAPPVPFPHANERPPGAMYRLARGIWRSIPEGWRPRRQHGGVR